MSDPTIKPSAEAKRPKTGRSPAYPGVPLETALEKAKSLLDAEGKYAVPMSSAFKAWGYGEKSSGGRETRAALRYFGLVAVEGDGEQGKIKLTEDALRVLLDEREDQTEKQAIIRRLGLTPAIHKKLLEKFPDGIKSDATVQHYLIFEESYNKAAAAELVAEFKETAAFAGLYKPSNLVVKSPEDSAGQERDPPDDQGDEGGKVPPKPLTPKGQVKIMEGERVAFTEEAGPGQYLKLIAAGEVDDTMLEALEDFVKRQRKRIKSAAAQSEE